MVCMYLPDWLVGTSKILMYTLIVLIITISTIIIGLRHIIKNDWEKYRCNPAIIPFAGLFGYDPTKTFTECIGMTAKESSNEVITPYGDLFSIVQSTASNMGESLGDMRAVISKMTDSFSNNINSVFRKFGNIGATAQYMMYKIQAIFQKILALYVTLLYFAWSMLKGLEAIVRDPVIVKTQKTMDKAMKIISKPPKFGKMGKAIAKSAKKTGKKIKKAFCFDGNTKVIMHDNTRKMIKDIVIGDKLFGNQEVQGVMKFSGADSALVNNSGIITTEYHHTLYDGKFIRSCQVPTSTPVNGYCEFLYDIETSNHRIVCANNYNEPIVYTDFSEIDDEDDRLEEYELKVLNRSTSVEFN